MFIRTVEELSAAGMVKTLANGTRSIRYLTAADGMGFSFNDNRIAAGGETTLWYKHHWEANYIVSGSGEVTELSSGRRWPLAPGVLYVVGPNDRHLVRTHEEVHLVSIFCPALRGDERHDSDGAYPASGPVPKTDRRMFVKRADEMRAAGREKVVANGRARTIRMLAREDELGFGVSDVHLAAGSDGTLWYRHHREGNLILDGEGELTDLASGKSFRLAPGIAYQVGPEDRHRLRAVTGLHLLSFFCPAPGADDQHDAGGTLPPSGPVPPGPGRA